MDNFTERDRAYMARALVLAEEAARAGEVPVGAILVQDGRVLGEGRNGMIEGHDPSAHAEIVALRAACQGVNNYRLPGAILYVSLEPCLMCMGALIHARIERIIFAATDPKTGAAQSLFCLGGDERLNHQVEVCGGLLADEASTILKNFFKMRREQKKKQKDVKSGML